MVGVASLGLFRGGEQQMNAYVIELSPIATRPASSAVSSKRDEVYATYSSCLHQIWMNRKVVLPVLFGTHF